MYKCSRCGWSGVVNGRQRCLACYRQRVREWRLKYPLKKKAQQARYDKRFRETRREEYNAKKRRYYNPKTASEAWKRRVKWLAEGTVTRIDLIEIYELVGGLCSYCGIAVKPRFTPTDPRGFDHVISREKGGKHERGNIVVSCGKCNAIKGG